MTGITVVLMELRNNMVNKNNKEHKTPKNIQLFPTVPQEGLSILKFALKKNHIKKALSTKVKILSTQNSRNVRRHRSCQMFM